MFNSEAEHITSSLIIGENEHTYSINPLNWKTDGTPADKSLNMGACFTDYDGNIISEISELTGAYIDEKRGTLKVTDISEADYPVAIFDEGIFHIYDYQFCNVLFHIGNSRVYTLDDTTIKTRQISEQDIEQLNRKNEITSCFGGGNKNLFNIKYQKLARLNSSLMITSDGVHDYITVDQIEDIIADYGINLITCKKLVENARKNGSQDDISVVLSSKFD